MKISPFKTCPNCSKGWKTLEDFLADSDLAFAGYQINFMDLHGGLFYFSHLSNGCGTTMAVPVKEFAGLSTRPFLAPRGEQPGGKCPGSCVRKGDISPCPVECECVWVREVMQAILNWKKTAA